MFILIDSKTRQAVPLPFHTRLKDSLRPPDLWKPVCVVDISGARLSYTEQDAISGRTRYDYWDPSQVGLELISESDFMAERS